MTLKFKLHIGREKKPEALRIKNVKMFRKGVIIGVIKGKIKCYDTK